MIDVIGIIRENQKVTSAMIETCITPINSAIELLKDSIQNGKKILWCGNGGSAADAQHMAAELMGGLNSHDRDPIPSIALTTDTSFITAWSNDTGYSTIFSRQVKGLGVKGDVLVAISTSGNSENVIEAVKTARLKEMKIILLTGKNGGKMKSFGDVEICVPSLNTQRIQEF